MARLFLAVLVALVALAASSSAYAPGDCFTVTASRLNVRASPCTGSIIGTATTGARGTITGYVSSQCGFDWAVASVGGLNGYVALEYTSATTCSNTGSNSQTTNAAGVQLIEASEGLRLCAYYDVAGYATIGYGHKIVSGDGFSIHSCLSNAAAAETLLRSDLHPAERCVSNYVKVPLNSNQFSALVSFAFNVGCGNLSSSTLLRKLNNGDYASVCSELARWNMAGGSVQQGLVTRRANECKLFNS